jgi:hypothetical protein
MSSLKQIWPVLERIRFATKAIWAKQADAGLSSCYQSTGQFQQRTVSRHPRITRFNIDDFSLQLISENFPPLMKHCAGQSHVTQRATKARTHNRRIRIQERIRQKNLNREPAVDISGYLLELDRSIFRLSQIASADRVKKLHSLFLILLMGWGGGGGGPLPSFFNLHSPS